MIFHDRVEVFLAEESEDGLGNTIYIWVSQGEVPATVWPLDTSAAIQQGAQTVTSRYRIALKAGVVEIPANSSAIKLSWGPYQFDEDDDASGMSIDGAVEPHHMRGRLHHYELTSADVA
ncbi:phage head completion protein [Mycolicibacterium holsaticum]|uniref:Uncharacterized protein n=1 Tax=Mycolicibacterium holsaticum TaxID=152142 RepID=A0A1E3R676_9MYCO|nr:hypothetical protein [Mycolicibacterium holsaticum]ODQ85319.1 hypothetical protein BHQ17_23665 [Mycolicibacterium holsaticum]